MTTKKKKKPRKEVKAFISDKKTQGKSVTTNKRVNYLNIKTKEL